MMIAIRVHAMCNQDKEPEMTEHFLKGLTTQG